MNPTPSLHTGLVQPGKLLLKVLRRLIVGIGLVLFVPIAFLLEILEIGWNWVWYGSLPLSFCRDPETRKRAHILMLGATAGLHGVHGDKDARMRIEIEEVKDED